ncbi:MULTISPECIES: urease accessory protein UreE [unclassified Rhizobium]|uniref:urease accessory protein UreE n=1 Tax=unclassified Rhizobium TaxID=2613769 RepID=UPI0016031229|nr:MULTISPECIES: urease accessory protein UreE [unclassified Rhizobium]MBB1249986.1 urease accessory protein UreE [Rhizobium sp. G21]MCV3765920.1 urease accessory protein UreE [Rhizobium sp. TRM95796]
MPYRSTRVSKEAEAGDPVGLVVLTHDERHLRRKLLHLTNGDVIMLDLKEPVVLDHGDLLMIDGGDGFVEVVAADEKLLEVKARDALHQMQIAWHLGNRHLAAQIESDRILIERDHVIKAMLEGLDAAVTEVVEPFSPVHGAYHGHGGHGHHGH